MSIFVPTVIERAIDEMCIRDSLWPLWFTVDGALMASDELTAALGPALLDRERSACRQGSLFGRIPVCSVSLAFTAVRFVRSNMERER